MNLNLKAVKIVEELILKKSELKVGFTELENGCKIVDCGIKYEGSLEAGRLYTLACLGGVADVQLGEIDYGDFSMKEVVVATEYPLIACLSSQKAGWNIKGDGFFALGSGPARILAKKPKDTYEKIGYSEKSEKAVLALECSKYPPAEVCDEIANACNVAPENLYILVARTASLTGTIQISARALETCLYKMDHLGLNLKSVVRGKGSAPVPPIVGGDSKMMGITNDMIIYGARVYLESEEDIDIKKVPSNSSPAYGKPFEEIFKEAGYDFYKINPAIFAPAEVTLKNLKTGKTRKAGEVNIGVLKKSIGV
jgi:methenyltetrahydromethanopterin cyclohydrolase